MSEPIFFGEDESKVLESQDQEPLYDLEFVAQYMDLMNDFLAQWDVLATPTLHDLSLWLGKRAAEMAKELDLEDDLPE